MTKTIIVGNKKFKFARFKTSSIGNKLKFAKMKTMPCGNKLECNKKSERFGSENGSLTKEKSFCRIFKVESCSENCSLKKEKSFCRIACIESVYVVY
jgi:hypothetical protein